MSDLLTAVNVAVAQTISPEFIAARVEQAVEKLVASAIDDALRPYSENGKLVTTAIGEALKINRLDVPSYGEMVQTILATQIKAMVAPLLQEKLAADMAQVLMLAPREIALSKIADDMRDQHDGSAYGPVITVIVEDCKIGSPCWVFLDEDNHYEPRDKYKCAIRILIDEDGLIAAGSISDKDLKSTSSFGRSYGLAGKIRSYYACGTKIIIDVDNVCNSVGDY